MFFTVSKAFAFFTLPSNTILAIGGVGILLSLTGRARAGRACMAAAIVLFAAFGLLPLGSALIMPLELRFPPWNASVGKPDGIVVLGGAGWVTPKGFQLNEAAERITVVADLARRYPAARIVYSGGNGSLFGGSPEAPAAAGLLETFGVPKARLIVEDRSRNTFENAVYSKALVVPKPGERWLLVTSGYHMPRSIGAFRKAGFDVEAYPVDYRTGGPRDLLVPFDDVSGGLRRTDTAAREWIGLVAYWLSGQSSALFPGP